VKRKAKRAMRKRMSCSGMCVRCRCARAGGIARRLLTAR
jgi:hypothetical protein